MSLYDTFVYTDILIDVSVDASTSQAVDLGGRSLVGIITPATLTGSTLTFTSHETLSESIANYRTVIDQFGVTKTVPITVDDHIVLLPADFLGIKHLRIVSSGTEGADRTFKLVLRGV